MRKILFVIDSLHCAGAEKSLVSLLNLINYKKYSVDLQLFNYGGEFEKFVPTEVQFLSPLDYFSESKNGLLKNIFNLKKIHFILSRIKFSFLLRLKNYTHREQARIFWSVAQGCFKKSKNDYDIAIAYSQGVPTFYVADKVKARKKLAWVNTSYELVGKDNIFQKKYYEKFNNIVCVSDSSFKIFKNNFPVLNNRLKIIKDIVNPNIIQEMAEERISVLKQKNIINILTIGRLEKNKGYDIALEAAKILKEFGLDFKWYVLGVGPLKDEIQKKIAEYDLKDRFILLGITSNPYGYIKNSDIYVQTSRFEGFGLAIAEARILNIPVVTTEFDAVYNQMVQRKNGIVTKMDGKSVADGILELVNNEGLRKEIIKYLKSEKKGNLEEYEKFLKLIEE